MQVEVVRKRLCSTVIYRVKENVSKGWNWKKQTNKQKQKQSQKTCLNRKKKILWYATYCLKNVETLESKIIVSIPKIYCYAHKMK